MSSDKKEIDKLEQRVRNQIDNGGIAQLFHTLAKNVNDKFDVRTQDTAMTLNKEEYALLKLMMIDYLKQKFQ